MSLRKKENKSREKLLPEVEKLRAQLAEAEETLHAIRSGKVDALVVSTPQGDQVFTLKGAERPYRILMERMKDGAVTLAGDDAIFYCNQGFADMLKTPLEKMIGTGISQFISPADKLVFEELLRQGRAGSSKGEVTFLAGDGTAVPIHLSVNTMLLDGLSTVYLVATDVTERKQAEEALQKAHDELEIKVEERTAELVKANEELHIEIIERKRAEEALREGEEKYRTIIETASEGIWVSDTEGRTTFVNKRMAEMIGYSPEEMIGKLAYDFMDEEVRALGRLNLERRRQGLRESFEQRYIRKEGTTLLALVSATPLWDKYGQVIAYMGMLTDITERKQAEEELRKAHDGLELRVQERTAELEEANKALQAEITERKRAEEALRESEERLKQAQKAANAGTWDWNMLTGELKWSEEYYLVYGLTMDYEPSYENWLKTIHPDDRDMTNKAVTQAVEQKMDIDIEFRIIRPDGNLCWLNAKGKTFYDEANRPVRMIGITIDITERKRAKKKIEHLASFPQLNPIPIIEIDTSGMVTFSNAATAEVLDTLGIKDDARIFLPGDFEEIIKAFGQEKEIQPFYREVEVKDRIFVESIYVSKKLSAVRIYVHDITERKRAEEKIREQASLLDKAQDAIIVKDLENRITYWNKSAVSIYGWTPEEAIGKNANKLLYKEEPTQLIEARKNVIEKGEWMGELRQRTKEGKEIIVESHWTLVQDNEGKPKSILIINTNITEKKNLESHLLRAQRMESIGILAGGIAHNLNNMLTPMMMSLHMLKEKFKDKQSQKLLTILEKNSQRSANLIKQVLSFSRGVEGERAPLQVKHLITEIEKIAKETFPKDIEVRTDIQKDLFTISGDVTQLHQVIMNLCVNARDAMPDGGILNITASNFLVDENYARMHIEAKVGSYVIIAVSDIGIGIPPKVLDRIFEPFFTTKEFGKGTGLGLSTSIAIVKSHGGFIDVHSEVGRGAIFSVYLPAIKAETQNVEEQKLELLSGDGELILVAEDEDSVREITISALEKYGYNVLTANDGADAVAVYAQNSDKIRVILMDLMMPVMDGQASIQVIRRINPGIKIIAVSGLAEKDKLANIADHTNVFLPKPYTAERLLKTIHEVLSAK